jgi:inositol phosphorylceramide synthase catalytic subunit
MSGSFLSRVRSMWAGRETEGLLITLPFVVWPLYCLSRGEVRWELIALLVLVPVLATASAGSQKLLVAIFPLGLVGLFYDSMRFFKDVGLRRVHDCDLRALELSLFGITSGGQRITLHDLVQAHPNLVLDSICAVPYGTFIYASIAFAIYLYPRDYLGLRRYCWTFFALNVAGFLTHHLYPAAPPWYFHSHGCVVDLATRASEGPNLARVDAAMGFAYFRGFYARSKDIFGAMPSLHVTYPLLIVLEGWRNFRPLLRTLSVMFFASMVFAAVYLDHHWVLDVIAGVIYCLLAHVALRALFAKQVEREKALVGAGVPAEQSEPAALARS